MAGKTPAPGAFHTGIEALHRVLSEEAEALESGQFVRLDALAAQKAQAVHRLTALGEPRALPGDARVLLARCREINQRNGLYIDLRRRHHEQLLRVLHGLPPAQSVYDARGRSKPMTCSRYQAFA